jgi:hypothetical protein
MGISASERAFLRFTGRWRNSTKTEFKKDIALLCG